MKLSRRAVVRYLASRALLRKLARDDMDKRLLSGADAVPLSVCFWVKHSSLR